MSTTVNEFPVMLGCEVEAKKIREATKTKGKKRLRGHIFFPYNFNDALKLAL